MTTRDDFKHWPKGTMRYDKISGEVIERESNYLKCPSCFLPLRFDFTGKNVPIFVGNFCQHCGRNLRVPITRWEKLRYFFSCFGVNRMRQYPLGYIDDGVMVH